MKYVILRFAIDDDADDFVEFMRADARLGGNPTHLVPQLDYADVVVTMETEGNEPNGQQRGSARTGT